MVDAVAIEEDSREISYDGWKASFQRQASGEDTEIDLITARGPTRGKATVRALDISTDDSVAKEVTMNPRSPKVRWQHVVPVTGLQANKTYILDVVLDGCAGSVAGRIN